MSEKFEFVDDIRPLSTRDLARVHGFADSMELLQEVLGSGKDFNRATSEILMRVGNADWRRRISEFADVVLMERRTRDFLNPPGEGMPKNHMPGPSPREMTCTCWEDGLEGVSERVQVRHDLERRRSFRDILALADAADHAADCPVSPKDGSDGRVPRGGMKIWPRAHRGQSWMYDAGFYHCGSGDAAIVVHPVNLASSEPDLFMKPGVLDVVLGCFFDEPRVDEVTKRDETPWGPYAGYEDEERVRR